MMTGTAARYPSAGQPQSLIESFQSTHHARSASLRRPTVRFRRLAVRVSVAAATGATEPNPTTEANELSAVKDVAATQQLRVSQPYRLPIGFTKSNELLIGRLAMYGFSATLIAEMCTGEGPLALLGFQTGVSSLLEVDRTLLLLIGFNLVAALLPARGRFVPDKKQRRQNPADSLQQATYSIVKSKEFFGVSETCLTKENELALGRLTQLGLAGSLIAEAMTGKGVLDLLELETGVPLCEAEPLLIIFIAFTLLAAISPGSGKFVEERRRARR